MYNTPASEHIAEMIYMIERDVAAAGSDYVRSASFSELA